MFLTLFFMHFAFSHYTTKYHTCNGYWTSQNMSYMGETTTSCIPCVEGCGKCSNIQDCEKCHFGYYITPLGICLPCKSDNCGDCDDEGSCSMCLLGFYLTESGTCRQCAVDNCDVCDVEDQCKKCSEGYFLEDNNCYPCGEKYLSCKVCASRTDCGSCKTGASIYKYEDTGDSCYYKCDSSVEGCVQCFRTSCQGCQSDFFYYKASGKCLLCGEGCLRCDGPDTCKKCWNGDMNSKNCYNYREYVYGIPFWSWGWALIVFPLLCIFIILSLGIILVLCYFGSNLIRLCGDKMSAVKVESDAKLSDLGEKILDVKESVVGSIEERKEKQKEKKMEKKIEKEKEKKKKAEEKKRKYEEKMAFTRKKEEEKKRKYEEKMKMAENRKKEEEKIKLEEEEKSRNETMLEKRMMELEAKEKEIIMKEKLLLLKEKEKELKLKEEMILMREKNLSTNENENEYPNQLTSQKENDVPEFRVQETNSGEKESEAPMYVPDESNFTDGSSYY